MQLRGSPAGPVLFLELPRGRGRRPRGVRRSHRTARGYMTGGGDEKGETCFAEKVEELKETFNFRTREDTAVIASAGQATHPWIFAATSSARQPAAAANRSSRSPRRDSDRKLAAAEGGRRQLRGTMG
eukprot:6403572-Pyramimonas_sp.AAC.1